MVNYRVLTVTSNPLGEFEGRETVQNDLEVLLGEVSENEGEIVSVNQVLTEPHILLTTVIYKVK
ncbi:MULTISPECIES: hypothetical protein [Carnobacterium]|uniref:Uncharacterized protein n=3 Tax=Carnobacterium TaxID=2747 RepID=U5S9F4_9LACT|nr:MULTISPECIES: hypothetical protein [Carnobacterium]AGY81656.1 hypothetical protein Q783_05075 [Carnobacterium inhibens subsp. gilichinskyi]MBC9824810.1 hypothetical protein [Carnobacterium inhibens]MDN5372413.1 hypothetical protein [Carnobacterium sp.]UDE95439.1 hypothetical protein LHA31_01175 [Carnobacterium viridans]SDQ08099.1 hypothetical protein SAMN04487752_0588 [Carnobacterium viridans]